MTKATHGRRISELKIGQSAVLEKVPSGGSVEARRLRSGAVMFYWRHTENARTERIPIGHYDSSAPPKSLKQSVRGYSVLAAIEAARDLAKANQATPGGLRQARERERAARDAEAAASEARAKYTLEALCDTYVRWLERQGKSASGEARLLFRNHLLTPYPDLAPRPASTLSKREIVTAMRRLTEKGQMATARKLRSYLRAAYACALRADSDAVLPSAFVAFEITSNPVEATAPVKNQSAKNPLPAEDLRAYWTELQKETGAVRRRMLGVRPHASSFWNRKNGRGYTGSTNDGSPYG